MHLNYNEKNSPLPSLPYFTQTEKSEKFSNPAQFTDTAV
jgi:hypothetical protein